MAVKNGVIAQKELSDLDHQIALVVSQKTTRQPGGCAFCGYFAVFLGAIIIPTRQNESKLKQLRLSNLTQFDLI